MFHFNFFLLLILCQLSNIRSDCGCNARRKENANVLLEHQEKQELPKQSENEEGFSFLDNYSEDSDSSFDSTLKKLIHEGYNPDADKLIEPDDMLLIPGGLTHIGTDKPIFKEDNESPQRDVEIKPFLIDRYEVSNAKFQSFIDATGYVTEAEKFGDSFVFKELLSEETQQKFVDYRVANAPWWYKIDLANWKHPAGIDTGIKDRLNHPVVHVSWHDAVEFCQWQGKRLPTEAEWETACRGGRKGKLFPWGDKLMPNNEHKMNIWQGEFPDNNLAEDGYHSTCPVDRYKQNSFGLYNMVGNVWEWTADQWDTSEPITAEVKRVKKGGSYLCHASYCYRYRCAARSQNTADSSAGNLGFRCAKDGDA